MDNEMHLPGDMIEAGEAVPAGETAPLAEAGAGSVKPAVKMPPATSLAGAKAAAVADSEKNIVFATLVRGDTDIAGLVAYSIYKQNKLDWLQAFETAKGRAPGEPELSSYIIGESTARRLATYRHLAEATLAGNAPALEGTAADHIWDRKNGPKTMSRTSLFVIFGVVLVLAIVAAGLVVRLASR